MQPSRQPLVLVFFFLCPILLAAAAHAEMAKDSWALKSGQMTVKIKSWGQHCGERPKASHDRNGVLYDLRNDSLHPVRGARPIFQAGICQKATGLPSLKEIAGPNRYRCSTSAGAGTQVTGNITRRRQNPSSMRIDHTFEYEWRLRGDHCQLQTKGVWILESVSADGQVAPIAAQKEQTPSADQAIPSAKSQPAKRTKRMKKRRCRTPGRAKRIVSETFIDGKNAASGAAYNQLSPGLPVSFDAQLTDAKGCKARGRIRWSTERGTIDRNGQLQTVDIAVGTRFHVKAKYRSLVALFPVEISGFSQSILPVEAFENLAPMKPPTSNAQTDASNDGLGARVMRVFSASLLALGIALLLYRRRRALVL